MKRYPATHLQIALALERAESLVQQYVSFTGFVEGWALYAERLHGSWAGMTVIRWANLGRLQFEALRAARLVVDTGIHAQGWDFERAVTFFQEATGIFPWYFCRQHCPVFHLAGAVHCLHGGHD